MAPILAQFLNAQAASSYDLTNLTPVWLTLHIAGGQIGLPLAVVTFIFASRSAGRYLTLINFCVTWIIYSIVYCILLYAGQATENLLEPTSLCLAQASLIHGVPPMAAVAGLEVVVQLWCVQRHIHRTDFRFVRNLPGWAFNVTVILPPYIALTVFSLIMMSHGLHDKRLVLSSNHIYCTTGSYRFSLIVPLFCAIVMAAIIFVEGMICYNWYIARKEVNSLFKDQKNEFTSISEEFQPKRSSVSMGIRVGLFTLYSITTLSACIVFLSNRLTPFPYMVEASLPLVAFLLFGIQRDTIRVWFFWKCMRKTQPEVKDEKTIPSARSTEAQPSIESILATSPRPSFESSSLPTLSHDSFRGADDYDDHSDKEDLVEINIV